MMYRTLSIFGDESFPKWESGPFLRRRKKATDVVRRFLVELDPELVYIIPTKGTNSVVPLICKELKIPFIIVTPFTGCFDTNPAMDKICIEEALKGCRRFILVEEQLPLTDEDASHAMKESVDLCYRASNGIAFIHTKNPTKEYKDFMGTLEDIDELPMWELIYGSR